MIANQPEHRLRLAPIDRPRSWLVRLFNWLTRRQFGKAIMPARVIYARFPTLLWRMLPMYHLFDRGLSLEPALRHAIEVRVSVLHGCTFCEDVHRAVGRRERVPDEKLAPGASSTDACFDARERAALAYVEAIAGGMVSDEIFGALRACFEEREIIEITWLQAFTTYLNRLAVPLGIGSDGLCELATARPVAH